MTTDRCSLAKLLTVGLVLAVAPIALPSGFDLSSRAAEPDGRLRIETAWLERGDPDSLVPGRLQLRLSPLAATEDAKLTVTTPLGVALLPRAVPSAIEFGEASARTGERVLQAELGRLVPSAGLTFEFEVQTDAETGGVAAFVIDARTAEGRPFREALGLFVGKSRSPGVRRLGAVEFPAAVGPRPKDR